METVGARTYSVKRSEFPLSLTIAPRNTTGSAATMVIVGHVREVKDGVELDERDAEVSDDEGLITYQITEPRPAGRLAIVQTLLGFFAKAERDNARFEITIKTSTGELARTAIRRPTFNPGTATLTFHV